MKSYLFFSLLFTQIFLSAVENQMNKIRSAIIHKDHTYLKKTLVNDQKAHEVINFIKTHRQELLTLAEHTKTVTEIKENLKEKKYTNLKHIGVGTILTLYGGGKIILGSTFESDQLESDKDQGFFSYNRLTDAGIGLTGLYYIYYGLTGRNPRTKLDDAFAIIELLKNNIPEEEENEEN